MRRHWTAISVCVALFLLITGWQAAGQSRREPSQEAWEYRIVSYAVLSGVQPAEGPASRVEDRNRAIQERQALNADVAHRMTDFGRQGWELVCFHEDVGFVFKRSYYTR